MNTFWDAVIAHEAPASLCWEWVVACDEAPFDGEHFMRVGIRPTALPVICLDDDALRFDPFELLRSARDSGCFGTLNCSCGYAEDVGLGSDIMVSHPDPQHIVWELERAPSRNIIEPEFQGDEGFVRLVFERCNYETEVRRMFETLQAWLNNPPRVSDLFDYDVEGSVPWLQSDPPFIPDWFEPETLEMQPEKILAADATDLSSCAPEIPADAIFEFGFIPEQDGYSRQYFRLSFDLDHRGIERLFFPCTRARRLARLARSNRPDRAATQRPLCSLGYR